MADSPWRPQPRSRLGLGLAIGIALGLIGGMVVGTLVGFRLGTESKQPRTGQGVQEEAADLTKPQTIERDGFRLEFPGNWRVATEDDDYNPDEFFTLESPGGSYVTIEIVDEEVAVDEEVRLCVADFVPEWLRRPDKESFTAWGAYEGLGLHLRGRTVHGDAGGVRIFAHSSPKGSIVVSEVTYDADLALVTPGLELIRKSLELLPRGSSGTPL